MQKKFLRRKLLALRKKKYYECSNHIALNIINFLRYKKLNKVKISGYCPINFEIDCYKILKKLYNIGYSTSLPIVKKNNQMDFCKWTYKDPLILNSFGIPEPLMKKVVYPEVLLIPLLGFDKRKYRIGYGGGYYDRYLENISKKKQILSIGIAFDFQQINKIPETKFDKKLDLIITDKRNFI